MNKIYKKVWNKTLGRLVVASELASSDSGGVVAGASATVNRSAHASLAVAIFMALVATTANAQDMDLGTDGSVTAGRTVLDNDGLRVGNAIAIGVNSVTVGSMVMNASNNTLTGLSNRSWNGTAVAGRAATEDQLKIVSDVANSGWTLSVGGTDTRIAPNGKLTLTGGSNIALTQTTTGGNPSVSVGLNPNVDLGASGSLTTGNTVVNNAGVRVGSTTAVTSTAVTVGNSTLSTTGLSVNGGPSITTTGINAAGQKISNVNGGTIASGSTEAVTGGQLYTLQQQLYNTGQGTRYFRANSQTGDSTAEGQDSMAIGNNASTGVAAEDAIALGSDAATEAARSVAIGNEANAGGEFVTDTIAMGTQATITGALTTKAMALGAGATAGGNSATAVGADASATGANSVALGQASAAAANGLAAGNGATVDSPDSIALGTDAGVGTAGTTAADRTSHIAIGTRAGQEVVGNQTTAIGFEAGSKVVGDQNVAIGSQAGSDYTGDYNVAIGFQTKLDPSNGATVNNATAIGRQASATTDAVALGAQAMASGNGAVALGRDAVAGSQATAVGRGAIAQDNGVALGSGSRALTSDLTGAGYLTGSAAQSVAGVVSVGDTSGGVGGAGYYRRIVNVADGAQNHDAANIGQLKAAQQSVANLVGGGVTVGSNGEFTPFTLTYQDGSTQQFASMEAAISSLSSGQQAVGPNGVIYNANGQINNVAAGTQATDAVNVEQLNETVEANRSQYVSVASTGGGNVNNNGATAVDAIAIGKDAVAAGVQSTAMGYDASAAAEGAIALGRNVEARAINSTVLGNSSYANDRGGISIGSDARSTGVNSITIGTNAQSDPKTPGGAVNNAIVIGTDAEVTANDGIAMGRESLSNDLRGIAQGFQAQALAADAMAEGTRATANAVRSQASGTDAVSNGVDSQASGTRATSNGTRSVAQGTDALAHATDGIAMGSNAVAGFQVIDPATAPLNVNAIAIGRNATGTTRNTTAVGNDAQATGLEALAVGNASRATAQDASAFGNSAQATASRALASGMNAVASGASSSAVGTSANASGQSASALGSLATASGNRATAVGDMSQASGTNSIAMGPDAQSTQNQAVAIGSDARSTASQATTVGAGSRASGTQASAFGTGSTASGNQAAAFGSSATASAENALAAGNGATANAVRTTALGAQSVASGVGTTVVGQAASATRQDGVAVGRGAQASGLQSTVIGATARVADDNGVAMGYNAASSLANSMALGANSVANQAGSVALGANSITQPVVSTAGATIDGRSYTYAGGVANSTVSVGSDSLKRTITNVAAGRVSSDSTDAINGSQLYGTNLSVQALAGDLDTAGRSVRDALGGTSSYNQATHTVNAGLSVGGNTYNNVQDALTRAASGFALTANGDGTTASTVGVNSPTGARMDVSSANSNITVAKTAGSNNLTVALAKDVDLGTDGSLTTGETLVNTDGVTVNDGVASTTVGAGSVALNEGVMSNVSTAAGNTLSNGVASTTSNADGVTVNNGVGAVTSVNANGTFTSNGASFTSVTPGNVSVFSGGNASQLSGTNLQVGGANPIVVDGVAGTVNGLENTTFDPDNFVSGQAASEDQLKQVSDVANAGWNVTDANGNAANIGPNGDVTFTGDSNLTVAQTGVDDDGVVAISLNKDVDLGATGSVTTGNTLVNNAGVAVNDGVASATVGAGSVALNEGVMSNVSTAAGNTLRNGVASTVSDADGITVNNGVGAVTSVNANGTFTSNGASFTSVTPGNVAVFSGGNASQLSGTGLQVGGANPIVVDGMAGTINGLENTTFDPDNFVSGQAASEDQLKQVSDVANAGWNVTDANGNAANIGPNGDVTFTGDSNLTVAQTGVDDDGVVAIRLNKDLDLGATGSVTTGNTVVNNAGVAVDDGTSSTTVAAGSVALTDGTASNVSTATGNTLTNGTNSTTVNAGSLALNDGTSSTSVIAGAVGVSDGINGSTLGATSLNVGGASPLVINGATGTVNGLSNTTFDPNNFVSGQAASEDQLKQVSDVANAGWNVTDANGNAANIGPNGDVTFTGDSNLTVAQTGVDDDGVVAISLNKDVDLGATGSVTTGNTLVNNAGVTVNDGVASATVGAGSMALNNGVASNVSTAASTTLTNGLASTVTDADGVIVNNGVGSATSVNANGTFTSNGSSFTSVSAGNVAVFSGGNASQLSSTNLQVGGANPIVVDGMAGTINGLGNKTFDPNNFVSGQAASEDQLKQVSDAATAGWNVTDSAGNRANIGPNGDVTFTGDSNLTVAQTGVDDDGVVAISLNKDLDLGATGSVTTGNTVVNNAGVAVDDGMSSTVVGAGSVALGDGTSTTDITSGSVALNNGTASNVSTATGNTLTNGTNSTTVNAGSLALNDGSSSTSVIAGAVGVSDGINGSTLGATSLNVGGASPLVINGATGTVNGLSNTTFDPNNFVSGQAASEDQLKQVSDVANAGWNVTDANGNAANIGPNGQVAFTGDNNLTVAQTGVDDDGVVAITLNKDIDLGATGSVTTGNTVVNNAGVTVDDGTSSTTVAAGSVALTDGTASNVATATSNTLTNGAASTIVNAGTVGVSDGVNSSTLGATALNVGGASPLVINGATGTVNGLSNTTFDPNNFVSGQAASEDQLKQVSDVANAGWNVTDANGNAANIGPNGQVAFTGDNNLTVAQIGVDDDGVVAITLHKDIDLGATGSVTTGNTVVNNAGVAIDDGTSSTVVGAGSVALGDGTSTTDIASGSVALADGTASNVSTATGNTLTNGANSTTVNAGSLALNDGSSSTSVIAGAVGVSDGINGSTLSATALNVGGASPLVINGATGTVNGLSNTTFDPNNFVSGQAASEDQLKQVSDVANAGWNVTDANGNAANIGPNGQVTFTGDNNLTVAQTGVDDDGVVAITLNKDIDLGAAGSVTTGNTVVNNAGVVVDDGTSSTVVGAGSVALGDGTSTTDITSGSVALADGTASNVSTATGNTLTDGANSTTVNAGSLALNDGSSSTSVIAGAVGVSDGVNSSTLGATALNVGGASPLVINGATGTVNGLSNTTFDPNNFVSGQAASEDQLKQVSDVANAGWNVTDANGNAANIGPNGQVAFTGDSNLTVAQTGVDDDGVVAITLNKDIDLGAAGSVTTGNTVVNNAGVAVDDGVASTTVGAGSVGVANGADATTIGAGSVALADGTASNVSTATANTLTNGANSTTVNAGTVGVSDGVNSSTLSATALNVGGASPLVINGATGTVNGLSNTTFDPNNFVSGQAASEDQLKQVSDVANAGWNVTDAAGNSANIGPNGQVAFTGDNNLTVAQTGVDDDGVVAITLNKDIDLGATGSVTTGNTVVNNAGVAVDDGTSSTTVGAGSVGVANGTDATTIGAGSVALDNGTASNVSTATGNTLTNGANSTTVNAGSVALTDGSASNVSTATGNTLTNGANSTTVNAGTVGVSDGVNSSTLGATALNVGGASPLVINGATGTVNGLSNTTFDPNNFVSGQAASEDQLKQVSDVANAGWNVTDANGNAANIGPNGQVAFTGDNNLTVAQTGVDDDGVVAITLNKDIDLGAAGSVTTGNTVVNNAGVAVDDGTSSTVVGAGSVAVSDGSNTSTLGATALTVGGATGGAAPVVINGATGTIGGLSNRTFDPNSIVNGQAATEDQLKQVSDVANAGWNVTDANGNAANIGPNGQVAFTGDNNLTVAQTGVDDDGVVAITLNKDIDLGATGSVTTGNTVVNNAGVTVDDGTASTTVGAGSVGVANGTDATTIGAGSVALTDGAASNVSTATSTTLTNGASSTTVTAGSLALNDGTSSTNVGAGTVGVSDGVNSSTLSATALNVGGASPLVINGATGTINGLSNKTFDPNNFVSGQAASEDQLKQVSDVANAGWNVTAEGGNSSTVAVNSATGNSVDLRSSDGNIVVAKTSTSNDVEFALADDLKVAGSVSVGNTTLNGAGVTIIGGPSMTAAGIDAGGSRIINVATGVDGTDAVNVAQLDDAIEAGRTRYYSVNSTGGGNEANDGATGDDAIASGRDATAAGNQAVAMGLSANAAGNGSIAIGNGASASAADGIAFGRGAVVNHANSMALGAGSATTVGAQANYQGAYVGNSSSTGEANFGGRQVTGVAAGSAATDAVNVSQLNAGVSSAVADSKQYTDTQIGTVNTRIDGLDSRVSNVEGDIIDIRGDITDIRNDVVDIQGDITDLGDRLTTVEGDIRNANQVNADNATKLANVERGAEGMFQVSQDGTMDKPKPTGENSLAGGKGAVASGNNSTALGNQAVASGANSTAIGQGAVASHDNSVALGQGSKTTVGAQTGYNAAYVGSSNSTGEVNIGGRTLTGLAPGIAGTDATNVNQLNAGVNQAITSANQYTDARIGQVESDLWQLNRGYRSATASAMAMAGLPQAYLPGKSMLSMAFGGYQSEYGMAVGLSGITDNGRWVYKAQASGNTMRDWGFSVGAGIQW